MCKNETLNEISKAKEPSRRLSSIRKEYKEIHKPYFYLPRLIKIILSIFIFSFILGVIGELFTALPLVGINIITSLIILFISIVATYYVSIYLEVSLEQFQIKKKIEKNAERIKDLKKEEHEITLFLKDLHLPPSYCFPSALNAFESYLINFRADDIKECINLYEQEKAHNQQMYELRTIQQIQETIYSEARSAKNIAIFSLFRN